MERPGNRMINEGDNFLISGRRRERDKNAKKTSVVQKFSNFKRWELRFQRSRKSLLVLRNKVPYHLSWAPAQSSTWMTRTEM